VAQGELLPRKRQ